MLTGRLSELADFLEEGSVPAWVREQLELNRDNFKPGGTVILNGPNGEVVTISCGEAVERP